MVTVVGIPDEKVTNLPAALIVRMPGHEKLNEHDITSVVAEKLPFSKQLYGGVYFADEMPMNPNGKILRRIVREIAIERHRIRYKTSSSL